MAYALGGIAAPGALPSRTQDPVVPEDEVLQRLSDLYVTAPIGSTDSGRELVEYQSDDESVSELAESSALAATRRPATNSQRPCTACTDRTIIHDLAQASCGHEYCRECLQDLFHASLADESLFPPRCCRQSISIDGRIRTFLSGDLIRQYEEKKVEFETEDKTYCSNPLCSAFIRVENIADEQASCPKCRTVT